MVPAGLLCWMIGASLNLVAGLFFSHPNWKWKLFVWPASPSKVFRPPGIVMYYVGSTLILMGFVFIYWDKI